MGIYPDIENHYRDKFIAIALERYPELKEEQYIIQEKIHGANFSIEFLPDGVIKYYRREAELQLNESFYGWQDIVSKYADLYVIMKNYSRNIHKSVILHGELFGKGIQKGIDYGNEKRILFYDMRVDNILIPQCEFVDFMSNNGLTHYLIPIKGMTVSLKLALEFPDTFQSLLTPKIDFYTDTLDHKAGDNIAEGIVIKPFRKIYWIGDEIFYLKKKPEMWREVGRQKQIKDEKKALLPQSPMLHYLTENRRDAVLSKLEPFTSKNQIGKYAPLIVEDAVKEWIKDHPDDNMKQFQAQHMSITAKLLLKLL